LNHCRAGMSDRSDRDRVCCASQSGFSLIELIVVLLILTTVMAISAPRFAGRSEAARLQAVVADVQGLAIAARSKAVLRGSTVAMAFNEESRSFQLYDASSDDQERAVLGRPRILNDSYSVQVSAEHESETNDQKLILFYSNGSASAGDIEVTTAAGTVASLQVSVPMGRLVQSNAN